MLGRVYDTTLPQISHTYLQVFTTFRHRIESSKQFSNGPNVGITATCWPWTVVKLILDKYKIGKQQSGMQSSYTNIAESKNKAKLSLYQGMEANWFERRPGSHILLNNGFKNGLRACRPLPPARLLALVVIG
jgi:hypothetical protein